MGQSLIVEEEKAGGADSIENSFEVLTDSMVPLVGAYNENVPMANAGGVYQMIMKNITNVTFKMARNELKSLEGFEAHLLRGSKFFSLNMDDFTREFQLLKWITYSENFNPLLIEIGKWKGRTVDHPVTDNKWGCTLRCLQMLVANALGDRCDTQFLFGNNKRAREAPFGI